MSTLHLDKLINPATIAVVGASARDGSPGLVLCQNLLAGHYSGKLFWVNPRYKKILGQECYKALKHLPESPELAIVLSPPRLVKRTLIECAHSGIKVALIMTAIANSEGLHTLANKLGIRLLGPYCAGIIRPHLGLNATYSRNNIAPGTLAIVTQSASLGAAILDWAEVSGVGFSALLSTGSDTDISLADLLDLLVDDAETRAIIIYLDRINGTRAFLSAISAVARVKPVVLMKSTQNSARYCDALTRTGQIYSSDNVLQAALNRAGVVRVRTFSNVFAAAKILTSRIHTRGNRLAIISNGAAPAMLACERIESKGFQLPFLPEATRQTLSKSMGTAWSAKNPVVLRSRTELAEHYRKAVIELQSCGNFDAILVIFVPDSLHDPEEVASAVIDSKPDQIPLLTCWMGEVSVEASRERFAKANIATFRTPEAATDGFDFLHRYHVNQQQLLQLPNPASRHTRADVVSARELVNDALQRGERVLGPQKTRALLTLFDIDVLHAIRATSIEEAMAAANTIGYPVALKLVSPNIKFKAAVSGTRLGINNKDQLRVAYREIQQRTRAQRPDAEIRGILVEAMHTADNYRSLTLSISTDATFGPVISVGIGGDLTALVQRRAVQLPPLNQFLIESLLQNREIAYYLGDFRHHKRVGVAAVTHVLRQLSELICELPEVLSLDINPLRITASNAVAMDVQLVLEQSSTQQRYAHLAIHPYPWQWIREIELTQQQKVQLRPIRPEDAEAIKTLVRGMSAESRYYRFMHALSELTPQMVAQFTKLDYDRQMAFVCVSEAGHGEIIGVSRYAIGGDAQRAEFAVSVADNWQGNGLATALMRLLVEHAQIQGLHLLHGDVLRTNTPMHGLMKSLGFTAEMDHQHPEILIFTLKLQSVEI